MAMDEDLQKLKAAILLLENMDGTLINLYREALQFSSALSGPASLGFASSKTDLRLLGPSREGYRDSNYSPQDMVDYLASFLNLKCYWLSVARTIVNWRAKAALQPTEWRLRTKQLQDAGDDSWRAAVPATQAIAQYGSAAPVSLALFVSSRDLWAPESTRPLTCVHRYGSNGPQAEPERAGASAVHWNFIDFLEGRDMPLQRSFLRFPVYGRLVIFFRIPMDVMLTFAS